MTILTPRQHESARLIAAGTTRAKAARRMGVTPSCIDQHIRAASKRLGVEGRRELAAALQDCAVVIRPRLVDERDALAAKEQK